MLPIEVPDTAPEADDPNEWCGDLKPWEPAELSRQYGQQECVEWRYTWSQQAHPGQCPPLGDRSVWLIMAGRGFGKTRAGAEWVRLVAETNPAARIALVAATLGEARSVMVEGESGIMACSPPNRRPRFEPSLRRLTWPAGAEATLYSAIEAESLRGPQHSHAWCDEIAKWSNTGGKAVAAWDNLLLGMRLGPLPRVLATTTPRAVALVRRLTDDPETAISGSSRTAASAFATTRRWRRSVARPRRSPICARRCRLARRRCSMPRARCSPVRPPRW